MANASEERRQRGIEDGWISVGAFATAENKLVPACLHDLITRAAQGQKAEDA